MRNKWKSRKFWSAIVTALLIVANQGLDLGIPEPEVMVIAGLILGWIFAEAIVDCKNKGKEVVFNNEKGGEKDV